MDKKELDILFLHPGGSNPKGLQGPYFPMGMIGLSSYLEKNGFSSLIINIFLEKIIDKKFDITAFLKNFITKIIGIDLHWFVHSYEAIELARLCKYIFPDTKILLGGITVSHFDLEIMNNFPFIDFIIRGDAEKPLKDLISIIKNNDTASISKIDNLTYRDNNNIFRNTHNYIISKKELDEIDFLRFDLVLNFAMNLHLINTDYLPLPGLKRTDDINEYFINSTIKCWILYTGRGCSYNCSFCGGAYSAYEKAFGRKIILRSPEKVAEDILRFHELNFDIIYIPHSPLITSSQYHNKILDIVCSKYKKLNIGFIFEDCPFNIDLDLFERYIQIFNRSKSIVRLYLSSIDNDIAHFNNFPIDTESLKLLIKLLSGKTNIMVGPLIGLPGQTKESTIIMGDFLKEIKAMGATITTYNAELHPGSELHSFPRKYNAAIQLNSFNDYYNFLKNKTDKNMTYGYSTDNDIDLEGQRKILDDMIITQSDLERAKMIQNAFKKS